MDRIDKRAAISVGISVTIGLLAAYFTEVGLALSVTIPPLCFLQTRRSQAFIVSLGYYAAASSIMIPGARNYFGPNTGFSVIIWMWIPASILLALSYALLWSDRRGSAIWRAPIAILASVPPPLGIIGWANPLTAAGILFPGTAWIGLLLILAFAGLSTLRPRISFAVLLVSAAITNAAYPGIPAPPADWEAINTTYGGIGLEPSNPVIEFKAAQDIQQRALKSRAKVIVFPEAVVPRWSFATDLFWEPTLNALASNGKTILVGAGIDIPGARMYRNAVVARGAENSTFIQKIPVPISMWQPLGKRGVPLDFAGNSVVPVAGKRTLILIGYEKFLTWPLLKSMLFRPSLLIGVENDYWAGQTQIPKVQTILLRVWARLFRLPQLSSRNV